MGTVPRRSQQPLPPHQEKHDLLGHFPPHSLRVGSHILNNIPHHEVAVPETNRRIYVCTIFLWALHPSKVSLFLKLCSSILWHLSLIWSFKIVNLLSKAIHEKKEGGCCTKFYNLLKVLRNNLPFKIFLQLIFVFMCYFWIFYAWNHQFII